MATKKSEPSNFFCTLEDGEVRKIVLTQPLIPEIRKTFIDAAEVLFKDAEEIEFDGHYKVDDNEILFVDFSLPAALTAAVANPLGTSNLNPKNETPKTLFLVEDGQYYFQAFDKRKMLKNKKVIIFDDNTYTMLDKDALIIDNVVNAVYKDGKLYFNSYFNANRVFSLIDFYQEATNKEIEEFAAHANVAVDTEWFIENSTSNLRKQITLLYKSKVLDGADTQKIKKHAKKFKLDITVDETGKISFPNDKAVCKDILLFLNEQYWIGLISGKQYKTNSKRLADKK